MTESVDDRLAQIQADVRELVGQAKQDDELAPEPTPEQPVDGKLALLQAGVRELVLQTQQDEQVTTAQNYALEHGTLKESRFETDGMIAWSAQQLEAPSAGAQGVAGAHSRQLSEGLLAGTEDSISTVSAPSRRRSSQSSCAAMSASRAADDWAARRREQTEKAAARRQEGQHGQLTQEHTFQPARGPENKTLRRTSMALTPPRKTTPPPIMGTHSGYSCIASESPHREVNVTAACATGGRAYTPRVSADGSSLKPRSRRSSLHLQGTRSSSSRLRAPASPPAPASIAMGHWRPPAAVSDPSSRSLAAIAALSLRPQHSVLGQSPGSEDRCFSPDRVVPHSPEYQPIQAVLGSPGAQRCHATKTTYQTPPALPTRSAHESPNSVTNRTHESPAAFVANLASHSPGVAHERFRPRSMSPERSALFPSIDDMEHVMSPRGRQMEPQHATSSSRSPSFGAEPDMAEPPRLPSPSRRLIHSEIAELAEDLSSDAELSLGKAVDPVILRSPSRDLTPSERISKALGSALQQATFAERALAAAASSPRGDWAAVDEAKYGTEKVSCWQLVAGVWRRDDADEVRRFSWDEIAPEHSDDGLSDE